MRLTASAWFGMQPLPGKLLWLLFVGVILASTAIRIHIALQPGLWVDEVFSIAMATGHSLEHPAAVADPKLGDYVEPAHGQAAATWRAYLEHEAPPAAPGRIVRAVLLSDTNPPLYYLVLSGWTRVAGTTDAALRLFSILAALACFPLLWYAGRTIGGSFAAGYACVLFAFAPMAMYYSVEGRMYSLAWLLGLALASMSLRLHQVGARPVLILGWALTGAAALLTHYFLLFAWMACAVWLLLAPGRAPRTAIVIAVMTSLAIVTPWYLHVPETVEQWRVTAGWLDGPLSMHHALIAPLNLVWTMFAPFGLAEGWYPPNLRWMVLVPIAIACLAALRPSMPSLFTRRQLLPWLWLAAAVLGVVVFDLLRGTSASLIPRYALMGTPAAFLIVAALLSRLAPRTAGVLLAIVVTAWLPGLHTMLTQPLRPSYPLMQIAAYLDAHTAAGDLIILRSIPSGVLGITRYMRSDTPVVSWVEQLEVRIGRDDLDQITLGVCQVLVVGIHTVTRANTLKPWLRLHASLIGEERIEDVKVKHFRRDPPFGLPAPHCPHLPADT